MGIVCFSQQKRTLCRLQDSNNCPACITLAANTVGAQSSSIEKRYTHDNSSSMRSLARKICFIFTFSGLDVAKNTKKWIGKHMLKHHGINNPSGTQMLQFLNRNRHKMTCKDKYGVEKNYMKYAFDRRASKSLFEQLFIEDLPPEDLSVMINLNEISNTGKNGTPETVLDYMNKLIKDKIHGDAMTNDIKLLREFFVEEMGAKKYSELTPTEQQEALH